MRKPTRLLGKKIHDYRCHAVHPYGSGKCTCEEIRRMIEEGIIP